MGVYTGQLVVVVCIRGQGWSVAMVDFNNLSSGWLFSFGIRNGVAVNIISLQFWCACESIYEGRSQDEDSQDHLKPSSS